MYIANQASESCKTEEDASGEENEDRTISRPLCKIHRTGCSLCLYHSVDIDGMIRSARIYELNNRAVAPFENAEVKANLTAGQAGRI